MGKAGIIYKEMRFVLDDDLTHVYVAIDAIGDAPLNVQGWHYKAFDAKYAVIDLMELWDKHDEKFGDPVIWPQQAP